MPDYKVRITENEYLPLRDVVFNTIKDGILTGRFKPGERLLENQSVIKTPVVRNGKAATIGYQPEIWKEWE